MSIHHQYVDGIMKACLVMGQLTLRVRWWVKTTFHDRLFDYVGHTRRDYYVLNEFTPTQNSAELKTVWNRANS